MRCEPKINSIHTYGKTLSQNDFSSGCRKQSSCANNFIQSSPLLRLLITILWIWNVVNISVRTAPSLTCQNNNATGKHFPWKASIIRTKYDRPCTYTSYRHHHHRTSRTRSDTHSIPRIDGRDSEKQFETASWWWLSSRFLFAEISPCEMDFHKWHRGCESSPGKDWSVENEYGADYSNKRFSTVGQPRSEPCQTRFQRFRYIY